jgi:3D (Asp-Asp-Asp) domain-containing protein
VNGNGEISIEKHREKWAKQRQIGRMQSFESTTFTPNCISSSSGSTTTVNKIDTPQNNMTSCWAVMRVPHIIEET